MKAVTIEELKRELGDEGKAREVYSKVAKIGGFGDIGKEFKDGLPALDVGGISSEAKQKRIQEVIAEAKGEPEKKTADKKEAK